MSGGNYGSVILYLVGGGLALSALVLAALWHWLIPNFWLASLATFVLGTLSFTAFFGLVALRNGQGKSVFLRTFYTTAWVTAMFVATTTAVFWLLTAASWQATLVFFAALLVYWLQLGAMVSLKTSWFVAFLLISSTFAAFFSEYFLNYAVFVLIFFTVLNQLARRYLRIYLWLSSYPNFYRWFNENISFAEVQLAFQKQPEAAKSEFINHYLSNYVYDYDNETLKINTHKDYELVFWDLLSKGQANLAANYSNNGYEPTLIAFNFDFMQKWLAHAQQNPNSMAEIQAFGETCQQFISHFIENPEYHQCYTFKKENLEQKVDNILTLIPYDWESLTTTYGLVYTAIGISLHLKEPEY